MRTAIDYVQGLTLSMPVAELDRAIDWYRDVLGFSLQYRMDELGWCELVSSVNNVNVGLSVVEAPNPGGATPTFGVADIEAARAALQGHGVRIDGDIIDIEGMVRLLSFYDVDDNALMFYQMLNDDD